MGMASGRQKIAPLPGPVDLIVVDGELTTVTTVPDDGMYET